MKFLSWVGLAVSVYGLAIVIWLVYETVSILIAFNHARGGG